MRLIRPDASMNVPRGTLRQIWRQPCDAVHQEAIAARVRVQMRIPFTEANCHLTRGAFDALDLGRGTPEPDNGQPWRGLNARMRFGAEMRSMVVHSAARPRDVMFCGPPTLRVNDAAESLVLIGMRPERLRSISDADALAEGVHWWAIKNAEQPLVRARPTVEDLNAVAYRSLLAQLRAMTRNRWKKTEEHAFAQRGVIPARSLFILDWARVYGYQSWLLNPWVWVVTFALHFIRPLELFELLERQRRNS